MAAIESFTQISNALDEAFRLIAENPELANVNVGAKKHLESAIDRHNERKIIVFYCYWFMYVGFTVIIYAFCCRALRYYESQAPATCRDSGPIRPFGKASISVNTLIMEPISKVFLKVIPVRITKYKQNRYVNTPRYVWWGGQRHKIWICSCPSRPICTDKTLYAEDVCTTSTVKTS